MSTGGGGEAVPDIHIGIDARAASEERAGRGRYVRELLRHLPLVAGGQRFLLYARSPWECDALDDRFEWRLIPSPDPIWHVRAARAANRECMAFLSTNSYLTVWFLRVPSVTVIYDLVAFHPEYLPQRRARMIERATIGPAVRRSDALAAISEATRADLMERFPAVADKVIVTHLAADARFSAEGPPVEPVLRRLGINHPYVLVIGTLEPRKNVPRLIEAFASLRQDLRERYRLVLIGATGWDTDETLASIERHSDWLLTPGYVRDSDLPSLYRGAELFCYPSIYEGFGLPVLEALASGVPVLTSNVSSLPEVAGDAALYVNPLDVNDIAEKLETALCDDELRIELRKRGLAHAERFTWEQTARKTLELVLSAAKKLPA